MTNPIHFRYNQSPGCELLSAPQDADAGYRRFVAYLLNQSWHERCEIIPEYMPPNPRPTQKPSVQVRYNDGTEYPPYLRHSKGPRQGFGWDIYGDDMQTVELAILALSQAPAPVNVGPFVFTLKLDKETPENAK